MKKFILFSLFVVSTFFSNAQSHFSTRLELRLENGHVFADLIANEDYSISSLQFGFYHDALNTEFIGISSKLIDPSGFFFNNICPEKLLLSWYDPKTNDIFIPKNGIILTLEYKEVIASDHVICMMLDGPANNPSCDHFYREVSTPTGTLTVDDVCASYKIEGGKIKLANNNNSRDDIKINYNPWRNNIQVNLEKYEVHIDTKIDVTDFYGHSLLTTKLTKGITNISTKSIPPGVYVCSILNSNSILKSYKFSVLQ